MKINKMNDKYNQDSRIRFSLILQISCIFLLLPFSPFLSLWFLSHSVYLQFHLVFHLFHGYRTLFSFLFVSCFPFSLEKKTKRNEKRNREMKAKTEIKKRKHQKENKRLREKMRNNRPQFSPNFLFSISLSLLSSSKQIKRKEERNRRIEEGRSA